MNRAAMLARLLDPGESWDILVVGGGATGLGAAVDAAARGYRTALVEGHDFAKGTSSRSTKLVHGGVRYLQQGNVSLVLDALRERGRLLRNAPHLVRNLAFVVPSYDWWEGPFYGAGLKLYDLLAGRMGLEPSRFLSREETLDRIPTLEPQGLRGGVVYQDAQFDDARLAVTLARTLADRGGVAVNYAPVVRLLKEGGLVRGVVVRDEETGAEAEVRARAVVNATGVFADELRRLDDPESLPLLAPSQGTAKSTRRPSSARSSRARSRRRSSSSSPTSPAISPGIRSPRTSSLASPACGRWCAAAARRRRPRPSPAITRSSSRPQG